MYEHQTYELILQRMLDRIPDSFDKRESSPIHYALSPAALEIAQLYVEFDYMMNETFGDTASYEYLVRLCAERGITQRGATNTVLEAVFNPMTLDIEIGSRFSGSSVNYRVEKKKGDGIYEVTCEEAGVVGNEYTGTIIPVNYIHGLETAEITKILIYGDDVEDTEDLRKKYFSSFEEKAFSGNVQDYKNKVLAINGVGAVKIESVWNGGGSVRLTILDSIFGKATNTLIELVQREFDPFGNGKGDGLAPIGHIVTIQTVDAVTVDIQTIITFDTGYSWNSRKVLIEEAVAQYLLEVRKDWQYQTRSIIRIAQIDAKVLSIDGVLDVSGTKINTVAENLTLEEFQIPIMGAITVE